MVGVAVILAALHLYPSSSPSKSSKDPEKGITINEENIPPTDHEEEEEREGADAETYGESAVGNEEDAPPSSVQLPGSEGKEVSQTDTGPSLTSRIKSLLFPKEDPEALEQFVPNYRLTPILSGIVIPFSILLEIPGLTERWYIRTEGNETVETKSNSAILDVALAISLVCAVVANVCLIMRFLEKKVKISTLLTIIFLTLHDVINIHVVVIFGVEHRFDDGFTYGESFWITICSTVVSSLTNISLIVDYVKTPDFAKSGSGLTRKQRSLVIIVMILLVYIALGALCTSLIQDLTFINGLYFTVVTIETIGFGDITPNTTGARIFVCHYLVFGILIIGITIGMCRETILESLEVGYRKRMRRMRTHRREARRFRRWEARWTRAVEWRLKEKGLPVWIPDQHSDHEHVRFVGLEGLQDETKETHWMRKWLGSIGSLKRRQEHTGHVRAHHRGKHLNINALSPQQLEAAALEAGVPLEMFLAPVEGRPAVGSHTSNSDGSHRRSGSHFGIGHGLYRTASSSGWPAHPQTPTHAQIGRMAAMVTKFALAVSGTHVRMVGHASGEVSDSLERRLPEVDSKEESGVNTEASRKNDGWDAEPNGSTNSGIEDIRDTEGQATGRSDAQASQHSDVGSREHLEHLQKHFEEPKLSRQLAMGTVQKSEFSYEAYKDQMETEERRAYYVKLIFAWSLFLLFWMVGSAIFSATESWAFGTAMYFCFTAFTTCGYGDFAPSTPAGRSLFVVWALLGVGTMTILISVLQEAGSSKYQSVLHSTMFDNGVRKYRQRESEETARIASNRHCTSANDEESSRPNGSSYEEALPDAANAAKEKAQKELEQLPREIIRHAQNFHEHMHYFASRGQDDDVDDQTEASADKSKKSSIPEELKALLDQIAELEGINARAKREILQDKDARKTLFLLSVGRTLRGMINAAERSLAALAERDDLMAVQENHHADQIHTEDAHSSCNAHHDDKPGTSQNYDSTS
ncbi:unnamed protein product [Somion occarium]|uniref:Potassium channel domain-containing protein n=1 Tax=Somion occarium TaxID=3059160 RepID=A0ABP1DLP4_9APHY